MWRVSVSAVRRSPRAGARAGAAVSVVGWPGARPRAVRGGGGGRRVLAAAPAVVLDEFVGGKPADEAESLAMLERLSGRTHQVLTAVALAADGAVSLRLSASEVRFRTLGRAECSAYWHTGEPRDKAGGDAGQGGAAGFIEPPSGSL